MHHKLAARKLNDVVILFTQRPRSRINALYGLHEYKYGFRTLGTYSRSLYQIICKELFELTVDACQIHLCAFRYADYGLMIYTIIYEI